MRVTKAQLEGKQRESDIVKGILAYLKMRPNVVAWRQNSGAVTGTYKGKTRFVRFNTMPGMSDIQGWIWRHGPDGTGKKWATPLFIEVKVPGKKPSLEQLQFLSLAASHGCIAFVAFSVKDVAEVLGPI